MTWKAFHRRGDVLRAVIATADARRDGVLPMQVRGVAETFGTDVTLIGALQLRWHTRLAGRIERELMDQPLDLESAVISAWRRTAADLPGIHAILDHYTDAPASEAMARVLARSRRKDAALMAAMAGKASMGDHRAEAAGLAIEEQARAGSGAATFAA